MSEFDEIVLFMLGRKKKRMKKKSQMLNKNQFEGDSKATALKSNTCLILVCAYVASDAV